MLMLSEWISLQCGADGMSSASGRRSSRSSPVSVDAPIVGVCPKHPLRATTEAFIASTYRDHFDVQGLVVAEQLVARFDAGGAPVCAAGLRTAAHGFFSEAYLDEPIDALIGRYADRPTGRERIFEVTTLASRQAAVLPRFLRRIIALAWDSGFTFAFFTATERLRQLLNRMGIPFGILAAADRCRIGGPTSWGTYYEHDPQVCVVDGGRLERLASAKRPGDA